MDVNLYPVLLSVAAFISTLSGGLFVAKFRGRFAFIVAFAAGVLIAVPLFDLLPESLKLAVEIDVPVENIMYSVALGFISLYVLERYFSIHRICVGETCQNIRHPKGGFFGATELSAHSFLDGFAIGLGFHFDPHLGIVIAVTVLLHDFSDGINTVTIMLSSGNSLKSSLRMLLLDAIAPVLGALSTLWITIPQQYLVLLMPFFGGGFLYLGASDLLPEAHEKNPPLAAVGFSLAGFLLVFTLIRFLNL